jgi:pimeloyl-ACP methyl ester carboxylesterase
MPYAWLKDGTPLHYIEQGQGRPVVLMNALMYSARHFWRPNIGPLSRGCRVIALDPRGHGESGKPSGGYTVRGLADDLAEFLETKALEDVVLLGVALSGFVILDYLQRHGHGRVKAIGIVEMTPRLVSAPGWDHPTFGNFPQEAADNFGNGVRQDTARAGLRGFFAAGYVKPLSEGQLAEIMAETWLMPTDAIADLCDEMVKQDVREYLPRIPVPTLLMYGGPKNNLLPTGVGRWMKDRIPGSHYVEFADSGHNPFLEEPDRFNAELLRFVQGL